MGGACLGPAPISRAAAADVCAVLVCGTGISALLQAVIAIKSSPEAAITIFFMSTGFKVIY